MKVYKIRDKETGLFHPVGLLLSKDEVVRYFEYFKKVVHFGGIQLFNQDDAEIVEYEIPETRTIPVAELVGDEQCK